MEQDTTECHNLSIGCRDILTDILRQGAQEMLAEAIKNEVAEYVASHAHLCDDEGHRLVVRNGHLPERTIQTGLGPVEVQQPVECLVKDRDVLLTSYGFPAEHWVHLRTTNPIESTFATVRLSTARTKGCGSRTACLMMVFKLARCAEKHWRRLNGSNLIAEVIRGITFTDGVRDIAA